MRRRTPFIPCTLVALSLLAMAAVPQAALAKKTKAGDARALPGTGTTPMNILAIWGDDIGWFNLSIHNFGMMGYKTPNLDKLGRDWGGMFTDAYAEQSCTAGRAAFLTGLHGLRSGMVKVGLPGVDFGLHEDDPTIPEILGRTAYGGYMTGQYGKNHLGDGNQFLPTNRGFDEFFGNLYHLNSQDEPEHPDWPDNAPGVVGTPFGDRFGPRGVIYSQSVTDASTQPPNLLNVPPYKTIDDYGDKGTQFIVDTGALTKQRMKTIDGAFAREAMRFMAQARNAGKPFFVWYAASRMHVWTRLKEKGYEVNAAEVPVFDSQCYEVDDYKTRNRLCNAGLDPLDPTYTTNQTAYWAEGKTGLGTHPDGMVEHDMYVGELLNFLEAEPAAATDTGAGFDVTDARLKSNTIVMYTTDNGPESFSWPDGGTTPFRSEKATNWEGGYRVPLLVHWPGVISPGFVSNEIIALQDWFPTLVNYAGATVGTVTTDIEDDLAAGNKITNPHYDSSAVPPDNQHYKVHLDGYDFYDYFSCAGDLNDSDCADPAPRREVIYANDDGVVVGVRWENWKIVFHEQREESFAVWQEPFTKLRFPKLMNLRSDPFEKADHDSSYYDDFRARRMFALAPAQVAVYKFLQSFQEFPPRQAPPSFTVDVDVQDIMDKCGTGSATAPAPGFGTHPDCFPPEAGIETLALPNWGPGG